MQQPKPAPTSLVCHIIQCILFLLVSILALLPLIYHLGSHQYHQDIPHSLSEIFKDPDQQVITDKLNKKNYKYAVLHGAADSGIFEYLDNYADLRAQKGNPVIIRKNINHTLEVAFKLLRQTKVLLEEKLNFQEDEKNAEWIFMIEQGVIPVQEIEQIVHKHPTQRILIGVTKKEKIKGFKMVKYSPLTIQILEEGIRKQFQIPAEQAKILADFYGTIPEIFKNLDHITYTHGQLLGTHYNDLSNLNGAEKKVLEQLCTEGIAVTNRQTPNLAAVGVIIYQKQAYWSHCLSRLNYELRELARCQDTVVPDAILDKIQDEQDTLEEKQAKQEKVIKVSKKKKNDKKKNNKSKDKKKKQKK